MKGCIFVLDMYKAFPLNPTLLAMDYRIQTEDADSKLAITFRKGQVRTYIGVPSQVAYKFFYLASASETMSYYSNNIKKKYKVEVKKL